VMPVTAPAAEFPHNRIMQRVVEEAEYVLSLLRRMRDEVSANPELFDPGAQDRIDEAIVCTQNVLGSAQSQTMIRRMQQEIKAA